MTEKTKAVVYNFLFQFCKDNDESDMQQICCSVNREIMLYPAMITTCARPHFYELSVLHELLKQGNGNANCSICRVAFQARDIQIETEVHDHLKGVVNTAFTYLIPMKENLVPNEELKKKYETIHESGVGPDFQPSAYSLI